MSESLASQLKMVLDRESASQARHDIKMSALESENARLREALSDIRQYANDILIGPIDSPGDMNWHREGILEIRNRARATVTRSLRRLTQ